MKFATCSLSLMALFIFNTSIAQDEIHKRNGDVIEGKVVEVGSRTISYKKAGNLEGPNYVIDKAQVDKIEYDNGNTETISAGMRRPGHPQLIRDKDISTSNKSYGDNIISLSPMQITDRGLGIGVSYERVLDKKRNLVSFYMPVVVAFKSFNSNSVSNENHLTYYFMPGIKIYPTGGKGIVRYAVGPNLTYATGRREVETRLPSGAIQTVTDDFYKFGMMITNSLNINPTEHLHLGLELGLGFSYLDDDNNSFGDDPFNLAQFGFKIGYRF